MDLRHTLASVGGTASRAELVAAGHTDDSLARATGAGLLSKPRHGWYALPEAHPAHSLATAWQAPLVCISALTQWGLPSPTSTQVHLGVSSRSSLSHRGARGPCVFHHFKDIPTGSPLGAIDSARCLNRTELLVAVDAALNRGLIPRDFAALMTLTPPHRARWLEQHGDPRCQSPLETLARLALQSTGYRVVSQVWVDGVGRVDFVVDERVIVEVDGRRYHSEDASFREDRRRDRAAILEGRVVMRFTWADVLGRRSALIREVRAAVHLARARER